MHTLRINRLELYGYHGFLEEERKIGGRYVIDVVISGDFQSACINDDLTGTVDYAEICELIKTEFHQPSKLIEHVAQRILNSICRLPKISKAEITLTKLNPPVMPPPYSVSITLTS